MRLYKYKLYSLIYGLTIIVLAIILPIVETSMKGVFLKNQLADNVI